VLEFAASGGESSVGYGLVSMTPSSIFSGTGHFALEEEVDRIGSFSWTEQ
jgi:hypothetical protein